MSNRGGPIPILLFADSILGIQPYDWQCQILLHYEAGKQTAAACANFTGKTSTVSHRTGLEPTSFGQVLGRIW